MQQLTSLQSAVQRNDFDGAARAVVPLRNVLASVAEFREDLSLVQTPTELIAEPLPQFIALAPPAPSRRRWMRRSRSTRSRCRRPASRQASCLRSCLASRVRRWSWPPTRPR